jgi:hypothetical protein
VAIDGSLLWDIQGNDTFAVQVFELIQSSQYTVCMTPTAGHELIWALKDPATRDGAMASLVAWKSLGVSFPDLEANHHCYASEAVQQMLRDGIIPPNQENVALIICEAAQMDAKYVVFEDSVLPKLDIDAIKKCMESRDLNRCPHIISRSRCYKLASDGKL